MMDPPRLRDLSDGSDAFSRDLLRGAEPTRAFTPADAARLNAKVVAAATAKTAAGWFALGALPKGIAVIALVAGGALAVNASHRGARAPVFTRAHAAPSQAAVRAPVAIVATVETAPRDEGVAPLVVATPEPEPLRAPAPAVVRAHRAVAPVANVTEPEPSAPTLTEEMAVVDAARAAMGSDPARAVSALTNAERSMRRGQMRDERDALLVEALARSGRREEALARAAELQQRAPQSPQSARVRALLRETP